MDCDPSGMTKMRDVIEVREQEPLDANGGVALA